MQRYRKGNFTHKKTIRSYCLSEIQMIDFYQTKIPKFILWICSNNLLHSVLQSLGPSMLLKMALFCSFNVWVILNCIYVPHLLYPFLCWWTFRLLPCLGYCNRYSYEYLGTFIFWTMVFSLYMPRSGISGSYGNYAFTFLKDPKYCSP